MANDKYGWDWETGRLRVNPRLLEGRRDDRPGMGAATPGLRPLRPTTIPELVTSKLPTGALRDMARMALHGFARTGNTILRFLDTPNRIFGNTRSVLQDIYERSEANLEQDAYEDRSGVPQVGETAVHLASAGILGKALPVVFGANVGADTYETAKYTGASEGEALAKGIGHGVVDTAIWTLGQGLASKYLPKAWQWLGRELTGAMRGAASSVASDAVLNSLGADISGEEMTKRAVHAAWMVPLLGMLKMGGKRREEAMSLLRKARPDLAGAKADKVIETIEAEFSDPKSQKVALAWVARKGANLPDDTAQIRQALEVSSKVKGLDPMSKSPFEILSDPAYARYLPKPKPQDVKAFSNMKRYPMGVIGFDVSDDAAGRQATREMINAYMSPSSNPWCLATGSGATKLGGLGPGAESYWKQHSAVPKQIFFQEVDGKLELTAFRATSPGGEGRQEYWDTSDAGYSGIPLKVKVPGDPMGRYRKMVFRPTNTTGDGIRVSQGPHPWTYRDEADLERHIEETRSMLARYEAGNANDPYRDIRARSLREDIDAQEQTLQAYREAKSGNNEVQGTFEDIAPGKVFKGDPFRDGRSQTWVRPGAPQIDGIILDELTRHGLPHTIEGLRELRRGWAQPGSSADSGMLDVLDDNIAKMGQNGEPSWVLVEDKVRTTENGITKFRTTKYADPTDPDLGLYEGDENLKVGQPVEIEESELVSPEWMRARGYDPESESDVRRMQSDLNIQAWGNGVEAAMAVVPTRRTYMQTKSGTPETVTYGPNGRDVVSVDFEENGVPYREEYFHSGPTDRYTPEVLGDRVTLDIRGLPTPSRNYLGINEPNGFRLTRNPGGEFPEVLDELKWDKGLEGFVRTSGNRRWRTIETSELPPEGDTLRSEYLNARDAYRRGEVPYITQGAAFQAWSSWATSHNVDPNRLSDPRGSKLLIEDRQPDGTWAPAVDRRVNAETGETVELPPLPPEQPVMAAKAGDAGRFSTARNFLATDKVPESIFGIPVVAREEDYTPKDLAFFRKHPEAGGYYDLGDWEEQPSEEPVGERPMQAASKGGKPKPIVKGPIHYGPPPPPSRGPYPGIANNPGNVEKHERRSDKTLFKGEIGDGVRPKRFANFSDPVDGLTAAATVLSRRAAGLAAKGLPFTIENYVPGYAPKSENDVDGYIRNLSRYSGFARDEELDPGNVDDMARLLKNVVRFESGVPHSEWFTDDEYRQAALAMQEGAVD